MSQAGSISVVSSPSVPTQFDADTGSANPVANILNLLGDDTTANNVNGMQTTAAGNTVTIELTNRLQGTGATVGAVTADIVTFALGVSATVYRFNFDVVGRETTTGDGLGYLVLGTAKTDGITASIVATVYTDDDEAAALLGASITLVAVGNTVVLRSTGVAATNISYSAVGKYVQV